MSSGFFSGSDTGIGRFGFKNPFKFPSRSYDQSVFAGPMFHINGGVGTFTTTNTTDFLYAFSGNIVTFGTSNTVIEFLANIKLTHSAPTASVDVRIFMDFGVASGNGYYMLEADAQPIVSATLPTSVVLAGNCDLATFLMIPGLHQIGIAVHNGTAGTLTMVAALAADRSNFIHTKEIPWRATNAS